MGLGLGRQKACTTLRADHCKACVCVRGRACTYTHTHTHTHTLPLTQTSELGQRDQGLVENLKCEQRNKRWLGLLSLDPSPGLCAPTGLPILPLFSQRQTPSREDIFSKTQDWQNLNAEPGQIRALGYFPPQMVQECVQRQLKPRETITVFTALLEPG